MRAVALADARRFPLSTCRAYAAKSKGKVLFVDCGSVLLSKDKRSLNPAWAADALHPTGAGWQRLAACMLPTIKPLMA